MKFKLGDEAKEFIVTRERKIEKIEVIEENEDKSPAWFMMHKELILINTSRGACKAIAIKAGLLTKETAFVGVEEGEFNTFVKPSGCARRPAGSMPNSDCGGSGNDCNPDQKPDDAGLSYVQKLIEGVDFNGVFEKTGCPSLDFCKNELERTWAIYWILNKKYPRNKFEFALLEAKFNKYLNGRITDNRLEEIKSKLAALP